MGINLNLTNKIESNVSFLAVGGMDAGQEVGYVVIMRPNFRERITTVLDTKRRKRVSIHAAIERGIAGFESSPKEAETEEQLSEEEQKRRFFVYDTVTGDKLNFDRALKIGIIHYDSSATESIVFDEYAKLAKAVLLTDFHLNHLGLGIQISIIFF